MGPKFKSFHKETTVIYFVCITSHITLTITQCRSQVLVAHFSAEETEPRRLNNTPKVTELKSGRDGVQTQAGPSNFKSCVLNHCAR